MRHLIFGKKYIQTADLNNSLFINNVAQTVTMNGTVTRTTDHKGGNTAIQFGSGNLVSMNNLPISSVWSVAFWMKTNSTSLVQIMVELSSNFNNKNGLFVDLSDGSSILGKLMAGISSSSSKNTKNTNNTLNDGLWKHIVIIFDRNQPVQNEIKIYINNLLSATSTYLGNNSEMSGNFISDKIYLGGRGNSYQYPFIGATSPIKMFNYALTQTEIDNLYNE